MSFKLLGLDASTLTASVAVVIDGVVVDARQVTTSPRTHSEELMPLLAAALDAAGITPRALDAVAVGAGPGSFTGLRIGMATAKGIAFAADRPLWAVSSLAALAYAAAPVADERLLVPVMDARRGELYAGFYRHVADGLIAIAPEQVMAPGALAAAIAAVRDGRTAAIFGDALDTYPSQLNAIDEIQVLAEVPRTPGGAAVAMLALTGARIDVLTHGGPVYVRPSEAEVMYPDGVPGAKARSGPR